MRNVRTQDLDLLELLRQTHPGLDTGAWAPLPTSSLKAFRVRDAVIGVI
jgi:hypothetical protein